MKNISLDVYDTCPKCNSRRTGVIKPRTVWSGKRESKDLYRSIAHGRYVKYVNGTQYESYYKEYGINMYCEDCGYEFQGEVNTVNMNRDDADSYLDSRGCEEVLQNAKISKILTPKKMIKQFCSLRSRKEPL